MFAGSMLVGALNYLYYPVVGRLVSTDQFGEVQTLVSLFLQITLVLSVVADVTVNIVANATDESARNIIVYELERFITMLMALIVALALICIVPIDHFLHLNSGWPIVVLGVTLVTASLATQRGAFLRGVHAFGILSISQVVTASCKLIASVILVKIGFGTVGAIGGLIVAQLLTIAFLWPASRRLGLLSNKNMQFRLPDINVLRPELPYAALVLIVSVVTTVFFSIDVVLVKHFFSAHIAGEYAGVATIARIIYFLTGSVSLVLLSAVQLKAPMRTNRRLFLRSLVLTTILGGAAVTVFVIAPHLVIKLLIGSRYLPLSSLLPRLSLTMFIISIVNLVFSYDVALRRWSIAVISIIGMIATIILVTLHHASPVQLVDSLLIGSCILLVLRAIDSFRRNVLRFGLGDHTLLT
jgi:O-antigen/teichoic acid export membrane protein